jgi:hypothetical protein
MKDTSHLYLFFSLSLSLSLLYMINPSSFFLLLVLCLHCPGCVVGYVVVGEKRKIYVEQQQTFE